VRSKIKSLLIVVSLISLFLTSPANSSGKVSTTNQSSSRNTTNSNACPDNAKSNKATSGNSRAQTCVVPPAITSVTLSNYSPIVGTVIFAVVNATGNPTGISYQWLRNNMNISGQNNNQYTVTSDDINFGISVRVIVTNSAGSSQPFTSSATNQVPNPGTPPQISGASFTGIEWVGNTLYSSYASFSSGSPTAELTYQWLSYGNPISGATSSSYTIQKTDIGSQISVRITATNSAGSDYSTSALTSTIPNPAYNFSIGGSGGQSFYIASTSYGQTFTIPNGKYGTIDSIEGISLAATEATCSTYVRLRVFDNADVTSRVLLATGKTDAFIDYPYNGDCYGSGTFELDTAVQVVPGQSLYFELVTIAGSTTFQIYATYGDPYLLGVPYRNGVLESGYDVTSSIYMTLSVP
jgi:hypothetical protein